MSSEDSQDIDTNVVVNRNVDFATSKRVWSAIMVLIYLAHSFITMLPINPKYGWMILHLFHCVLSFFILHWIKGTPTENTAEDQGKWRKNTWWEQIDNGEQYTPTRKFLTILPIIPFLFTSYETNWEAFPLAINFTALLLLVLLPKLPAMHQVRVLKINED